MQFHHRKNCPVRALVQQRRQKSTTSNRSGNKAAVAPPKVAGETAEGETATADRPSHQHSEAGQPHVLANHRRVPIQPKTHSRKRTYPAITIPVIQMLPPVAAPSARCTPKRHTAIAGAANNTVERETTGGDAASRLRPPARCLKRPTVYTRHCK